MCGRERRLVLGGALLALGLATTACFHTTAPPGWLSTPEEVRRSTYGAWASVERTDSARTHVEGELIAVDKDSVHVLSGSRLVSLGMRDVRDVTLTTFDQPRSDMQTWMVIGAVSTLSHGVFLILSAPTWLTVGGVSVAQVASTPRVRLKDGIDALQKFARFPQGMPPMVDHAALKAKWSTY